MARDFLTIGPTPASEDCAGVGASDYYEKSRKECKAFAAQLLREFPDPPLGARIAIKTFPHDFGDYREVVVYYDDDCEDSVTYAFGIESKTPECWDEIARAELGLTTQ
jgi:hypothetical protein